MNLLVIALLLASAPDAGAPAEAVRVFRSLDAVPKELQPGVAKVDFSKDMVVVAPGDLAGTKAAPLEHSVTLDDGALVLHIQLAQHCPPCSGINRKFERPPFAQPAQPLVLYVVPRSPKPVKLNLMPAAPCAICRAP